MKRISWPELPGLLLMLLGIAVIFGWIAHIPLLIQVIPGQANMVINAAICYLLAGLGLYLPEHFPQFQRQIYLVIGLTLMLFSALIFSQYLFNYNSGIDQLFITSWLADSSPYPGRMPSNSTIAFFLVGVIFFLEPFSARKSVALLTQTLVFLVILIGVSALLGYLFDIDILYHWYGSTNVSVHGTIGYFILAIGMMLAWARSRHYHHFYQGRDDKKILIISILILFFAVFISNVTGFFVFARNNQAAMRTVFSDALNSKASILNDRLNRMFAHADVILTSPEVRGLASHRIKPDDSANLTELLSVTSISGFQLKDNANQIVFNRGTLTPLSLNIIQLQLPYQAVIQNSKKGYILQINRHVIQQGKVVGTLTVEWTLNIIYQIIPIENNDKNYYLCSLKNQLHLRCLAPTKMDNVAPLNFGMHARKVPSEIHGDGVNTLFEKLAENNNTSMATYRNIGAYGLVLLLKTDINTFYQPIRGQLLFVVPILLATILLGSLLLYVQVTPLVKRNIRLRKKAYASQSRLRSIMDHVPDGIITFDENGLIETINYGIVEMFACDAEDMIGQQLDVFIPTWKYYVDTVVGTDVSDLISSLPENKLINMEGRRHDGDLFPLELLITRMNLRKRRLFVGIFRDITAQQAAEAKLRDSEARFHTAFDIAPIGMALVSLQGDVILMNPAICQILGYSESDLPSLNLRSITHPDDVQMTMEHLQKILEGVTDAYKIKKRYYHKSGRLIWALVNVALVRVPNEEARYYLVLMQDITMQKDTEDQLHYKAHYDALTGLANRTMLEDRLAHIIIQAAETEKKFAVFYVDLDKFKEVNDTLGHEAGDRLLKAVAERLKFDTRKNDVIARIGGDEFILVLPELYDYKTAASFAERILTSLLRAVVIKNHELYVTASIGISFYPADGVDSMKLLKSADNALYRAKQGGRNNYQFNATDVSKKIKDKLSFERDMQQALLREEFKIYYLPIVSVDSKRVNAMEALLRWQSGQFGLVNPQQIIPIAEETGLIVPLSEWIIKTACAHVKSLQKDSVFPLSLTVNISARQFMNQNLIDSTLKCLEQTNYNPEMFMLEISENLIMQDPTLTMDVIRRLSKFGVKIVVDNFGTGYSSLRFLQEFDVDYVKIDRGVIQNTFSGPQQQTLVKAMIALAKNLGIKVIAEGVETREQYDFMIDQGCDEIQGYYISKPVLATDMKKFIDKFNLDNNDSLL